MVGEGVAQAEDTRGIAGAMKAWQGQRWELLSQLSGKHCNLSGQEQGGTRTRPLGTSWAKH